MPLQVVAGPHVFVPVAPSVMQKLLAQSEARRHVAPSGARSEQIAGLPGEPDWQSRPSMQR
jgi:hypothetical protein